MYSFVMVIEILVVYDVDSVFYGFFKNVFMDDLIFEDESWQYSVCVYFYLFLFLNGGVIEIIFDIEVKDFWRVFED